MAIVKLMVAPHTRLFLLNTEPDQSLVLTKEVPLPQRSACFFVFLFNWLKVK